jgi:hypothetical protein
VVDSSVFYYCRLTGVAAVTETAPVLWVVGVEALGYQFLATQRPVICVH